MKLKTGIFLLIIAFVCISLVMLCIVYKIVTQQHLSIKTGLVNSVQQTAKVGEVSLPKVIESERVVIYSSLQYAEIKDSFDVAEAVLDLVNASYFTVDARFPISLIIFPDQQSYQTFLMKKLSILDPPYFGLYNRQLNTIYTFNGSGLGTVSHEIMHAVIKDSLPERPEWLEEGLAAYFEKFFGYRNADGKIYLEIGFHNPWRLEASQDKIQTLSLKDILDNKTNTSDKRLVVMFLAQKKMLKPYLELIRQNNKKGYKYFIEGAFNKKIEAILPLWEQYLHSVNKNYLEYMQIPASKIFLNYGEYQSFMENK